MERKLFGDVEISRESQLKALLAQVRTVVSLRNDSLFTKFLPMGYEMITLDSVPLKYFEEILLTKVRIGTLITIYDDFADNPNLRDSDLLKLLYSIPFGPKMPQTNRPIFQLALQLWNAIFDVIESLPNYKTLKDLLEFDIRQFYNANRYCELLSTYPSLSNKIENRAYVSHNMGIIIVGTLDLIASTSWKFKELGRIRSYLYSAQEIARITNVLTTLLRELDEKDSTGEAVSEALERNILSLDDFRYIKTHKIVQILSPIVSSLSEEREIIYQKMLSYSEEITSFDAKKYLNGLKQVQNLHEKMTGLI